MIDIVGLLAANWLYVLFITLGGVLVSVSVHFVPVGGAPAAMAQACGIGTGTVQLAAGAGLTGLVVAGSMMSVVSNMPFVTSLALVLCSGLVGGGIMMGVTMIVGNWVYFYGVGCPAASAKVKYDPITKDRQDLLISQGTEGHAIPTVSFVSGIIGSAFGGVGGALVYYALMMVPTTLTPTNLVGLASMYAVGIFFVNSVIPSYNIGGTIEGFHDPKFKKWPRAAVTSLVVTFLCAIFAIISIGGV
jgi:tetrahydromethanopterin S-methyltransferase subunit D